MRHKLMPALIGVNGEHSARRAVGEADARVGYPDLQIYAVFGFPRRKSNGNASVFGIFGRVFKKVHYNLNYPVHIPDKNGGNIGLTVYGVAYPASCRHSYQHRTGIGNLVYQFAEAVRSA